MTDQPPWMLHIHAAITSRNEKYVFPFERIITGWQSLHDLSLKQTAEIAELKLQKSELQRQVRNGGGGGGDPTYIRDLEGKVSDLQDQQRRWIDDARIIIDTQKEKTSLQEELQRNQKVTEKLQEDVDRLRPFEESCSVLQKERTHLDSELTQLRKEHAVAIRERKDLADENIILTDTTLKCKQKEAESLNENNDLKRKIQELSSQLTNSQAGIADPTMFVDPHENSRSSQFQVQQDTRRVMKIPTQLLKELPGCHTNDVTSISVHPQGQLFASGSSDRLVKIWNTKCLSEKNVLRHTTGITHVQFSPSGDYLLACTSDGAADIYGTANWRVTTQLVGHTCKITGTCFGDDKTVLICSANRTIKRWDIARTACTKTTLCWSSFQDLATNGGSVVASAHYDGGVRFWDTQTVNSVEELTNAHSQQVTSVCFSSCGNKVLSSSKDGTLKLWDIRTYNAILSTELSNCEGMLSNAKACLSPDDCFMAIGVVANGENQIQIYDTKPSSSKLRYTLPSSEQVCQVAWLDSGSLLSAGSSGSIQCWGNPE
eukprot:TRINITY_DN352_c0_g2_i1.p1 TRINITY_DN352_c0_g2~~TRINITY_DN352_c0_g2_i1.p1  ORF type:complete len:544 (+),score=115.45 TRINITY_DN352_c0_g2_i1:1517-3148(+)